jgi:hypothetical protein
MGKNGRKKNGGKTAGIVLFCNETGWCHDRVDDETVIGS